MAFFIRSYNNNSVGSKLLADALNARRLKLDGTSKYKPKKGDVVINWGNSNQFEFQDNPNIVLLNKPKAVALASNKVSVATHVSQLEAHPFIISKVVKGKISFLGATAGLFTPNGLILRTIVNGSGGRGVYFVDDLDEAQKMYEIDGRKVQIVSPYYKKTHEYRIHVLNGHVFDVVQKRKRQDLPKEAVNFKIRNHDNGWVFCRGEVDVPQPLLRMAIQACNMLGLNFGAVDAIYNEHIGDVHILEVNTAPGLEGTTVENYANEIRRQYNA